MKSTLFFTLGLIALFLITCGLFLRAEDWTTTDGKFYKSVSVIKTEPDAVTIMHTEGGARVSLDKLPPDLQKRFNYDPAKAKVAADARAVGDAQNAKNLQVEMDQAQILRRINLINSDPRNHFTATETPPVSTSLTAATTDSSPDPSNIEFVQKTSAPRAGSREALFSGDTLAPVVASNHHSMDELVDINSRLKDDHPSPNRHTASSLLLASSYLMPDPLDPNHHSTDELIRSTRNLAPPAPDSTHHSMDSLTTGDPLARP